MMKKISKFFVSQVSWINRVGKNRNPLFRATLFIFGGFTIVLLTFAYILFLAILWILESAFHQPKGALAGVILSISMLLLFQRGEERGLIKEVGLRSTDNVVVATGSLSGMNLEDLYGDYLHGGGFVPDTIVVNFHTLLSNMWKKKFERYPKSSKVVFQTSEEVLLDYRVRTLTSLEEHVTHLDGITEELHSLIDWGKVQTVTRLSNRQTRQLKAAMKKFRGREMLSYGITELMPTSRGDINTAMFDLLLRNAGREYVESIPAMGDDLTSFGLYQFTSYAVFDTPVKKEMASRLNYCLPQHAQIPGSVRYLRGDDHYRAAWLFALGNISNLAKKDVNVRDWSPRDMVGYISMAHHAPAHAVSWYTNGRKVARMSQYRQKSWANYDAMKP